MDHDNFRENKDSSWDIIFDFILFLIIIVLTFITIKPFITALLFALLTAYTLKPLVNIIRKVVKFYPLALFITVLLILIPTAIFIYYAASGAGSIIAKTNEVSISLDTLLNSLSEKTSEIPLLNALNIPQYITNLKSLFGDIINSLKISIINIFQNITHTLICIAVYLISTYYFVVDADALTHHYEILLSNLSKKRQVMLNAIFTGLKNALDVLVVSYIALTIIITILAYIIYFSFSIPYSIIWAILTGLFALLPILGAWMIYGGISLYLYLKGRIISAIVVLIYGIIVLNILPDIILRPIMGSHKSKVHPLIIFLGFFGGPMIFGVSGFIIGPIIMVVGATVIKEYYNYYILKKKKNT